MKEIKEKSKELKKKDDTIEPKRKIIKRNVRKESDIQVVDKTVNFSLLEVIIIILLTGVVVSVASGLIVYNNYEKINSKNKTVVKCGELNEVYQNYDYLLNNYVEKVEKKDLIEAAISGMYNYIGDEYTVYLNKEETQSLEEQLEGEYKGVGIEITTEVNEKGENVTKINRIFSNSPAERAGMKAGDIVTKIDNVDVIDASDLANKIKNGEKESYDITYIRDGKTNTLTLTREKVTIDSVSTEVHGNVGYIKIETFSNTTSIQVKKAIDSFEKDVKSVVIDLRNNTGGYLYSAYTIADLFLEKGKVIYQLKDRNGIIEKYKAENGVERKFNKIAVITNGGSASASEILALALKESANAKIVGTKSYGKGTVQDTKNLESGAMVKYTTAYWLSPNGNSINKTGIKPDIEVKDEEKQISEAIKAVK